MEKKKGCLGGVLIFLILILIIIILIVSCGDDKEEPALSTGPAGKEVAEPPAEEPGKEVDTATLAAVALSLIEDNFEGIAVVSYDADQKSFNITPTDPDFVAAAMAVMEGGSQALDDWAFMVESMEGLSRSISNTLPGHYLQLVNPANPELSLLILLDGYVFYNFADE